MFVAPITVTQYLTSTVSDPQDCFEGIHLKGHKRQHVGKPIRMCPECGYQMATKACRACFLRGNGEQITHYCDTCYWNIHEAGEGFMRHKFDNIVMNCAECERYAARWRCLDCDELFCTKCFGHTHSRGKRIRHRYVASLASGGRGV